MLEHVNNRLSIFTWTYFNKNWLKSNGTFLSISQQLPKYPRNGCSWEAESAWYSLLCSYSKSGSNLKWNIALLLEGYVYPSWLWSLLIITFPQVMIALFSVTSFLVTLKIILNQQESLKPTGKQFRVASSEVAVGSWHPMPTGTRSTLMGVR